ncbi:pentatricopeptide repeat-containing protein [Quercus suber]|uniref:Pentatricopeptide repeat-containing protein n=1 Tax=Quercus suber TaxID=58331 RepID=A0AAW0LZE5_QUESU
MYSENGSLASSCALFDTIPTCDLALWNSMISAYIDFGCYEEALSLFISMKNEGIKEDERTISIMLSTCAKFADGLRKGKSLHAHPIKCRMKVDVSLGNALLSMYAELNCVEAVQKVFAELRSLNVISWNTMILALANSKMRSEAWQLFGVMQKSEFKPNTYTIISILATCEDETCLNVGRSIHGFVVKHGIEVNLSLNTILTDMYMNCGDEASARTLFESCTNRDLISWNSIIANYINDNQVHEALLLFNRMISEVEPNPVMIINVLSLCTDLANLPQGQCLHAYVIRRHSYLGFNLSLANAFITMYARCGSMQNAKKIFDTLPRRNIISWNTMITGYRVHGRGYDAILAFLQMLEEGYQPNGVTFLSVMSACSHSGLLEKGLKLFQSMIQDFNITPELAHYGCVVDLLGRGGRLDEARESIKSMPIKPDASVWRALLSACRVNYNTKLAENIFEKLVELEPMNPGNYVLLSNIYAAAGHWLEVRQIRTWLKEKGLNKPPGISWIVVRIGFHMMKVNMVESWRQFSHSEKLGFAFGLISLRDPASMEVPVSATLLSLKNQNHSSERWNSIIKHHTKLKDDHAILTTYTQMAFLRIAPDNATLPLVLKACARLSAVESGKNIHSSILGTSLIGDIRVGTALVDFYCKCGSAKGVDEMRVRDVVSWNALISGYVGCFYHEEAVFWFREMEREGFKANLHTVAALLLACGDGLEIRLGKEIHGYCLGNGLFDLDPHVGTALIGFYLKFDVRISRLVFDLMIVRSIGSWNAMINGYVDVGNYLEALNLFMSMLENGVHFDSVLQCWLLSKPVRNLSLSNWVCKSIKWLSS